MSLLKRLFGNRESPSDAQWQVPIIQEICAAMIRQAPQEWKRVSIVLERTEHGSGQGMHHSAITPEPALDMSLSTDHFLTPNAEVMAATRELELAWVERRYTFKKAIITAVEDADGNWSVRSDYEND